MLPESLSTHASVPPQAAAPAPRGTATAERQGGGRSFSDEVGEDAREKAETSQHDPSEPSADSDGTLAELSMPMIAGLALSAEMAAQTRAEPGLAEFAAASASSGEVAVAGAQSGRTGDRPAGPVEPAGSPLQFGRPPATDPGTPMPVVNGMSDGIELARAAVPASGTPAHGTPEPDWTTRADAAQALTLAASQPGANDAAAAELPSATPEIRPAVLLPGESRSKAPRATEAAAPPATEAAEDGTVAVRPQETRHPDAAVHSARKPVSAEAGAMVRDALVDGGGSSAAPDSAGALTAAPERFTAPPTAAADWSRSGDVRAGAPQTLGSQIVDGIRQAGDGSIELALSPEELGRIRLTLHGHESSLHVSIQADRPETESLMRRHIALLQQEFRDLGYSGISFDFGSRQDRPGPFTGSSGESAALAETGATAAEPATPATPWTPTSVQGRGLDLRL